MLTCGIYQFGATTCRELHVYFIWPLVVFRARNGIPYCFNGVVFRVCELLFLMNEILQFAAPNVVFIITTRDRVKK